MEESGYANVFSIKDRTFVVNVRGKVDVAGTTLPDQFRLYGFSVWIPSENVTSGTVFRFYDGDSTSDALWTMRFWQHGVGGSTGWHCSNVMVQDDSYIQVNNTLYYKLTSTTTDARAGCGITVYY